MSIAFLFVEIQLKFIPKSSNFIFSKMRFKNYIIIVFLLHQIVTACFSQAATKTLNINSVYSDIYNMSADMAYICPIPFTEIGAPYRYIITSDLISNITLNNASKKRWQLTAIPRLKIRMLGEKSLPVQSPSYVMGGTLQYRAGSIQSLNKSKQFSYISIGAFHHSNGQKGALISDYDLDIINTENGSFSTNYLNTAYHWGKTTNNFLTNTSVGLETQIFHIRNLGKRYGTLRPYFHYIFMDKANKNSDLQNAMNRYRLEGYIQWIFGRLSHNDKAFDVGKRLNIEAKAFYMLRQDWNLSGFAAIGYTGQDQYNIFFRNNYPYFRIGVSFAGAIVYQPFSKE